jgi:hypothetical protein
MFMILFFVWLYCVDVSFITNILEILILSIFKQSDYSVAPADTYSKSPPFYGNCTVWCTKQWVWNKN